MTRQNGYRTVAVITAVSLVFLQAVPAGVAAAAPVVADQASSASVSAPAKAATAAATQPTAPTQAAPATSTDFLSKTTTLGTAQAVAPASAQTVSSTSTTQTATAQATAAVVTPAAQTQTVAATAQTVASVSTQVASATTSAQSQTTPGTVATTPSASTLALTSQQAVQLPSLAQVAAVTAAQSQTQAVSNMNSSVLSAPADAVSYPATLRLYDRNHRVICDIQMDPNGKIHSAMFYPSNADTTQIPAQVSVYGPGGPVKCYSDIYYNTAGQITGITYQSVQGRGYMTTSYSYNTAGQLIQQADFDINRLPIRLFVLQYNAAGLTMTKRMYGSALQITETTYYQYDWNTIPVLPAPAGVIVYPSTLTYFDTNGVAIKKFVMDASGKIVTMTLYGNSTVTQIPAKVTFNDAGTFFEINYNTAGQVMDYKKTVYSYDSYRAISKTTEFQYNAKGQLIQVIDQQANSYGLIQTTYLQYNDSGVLLSSKTTYYQYNWSTLPVLPAPAYAIVSPSTLKYFDASGVLIKEFVTDASGKIVSMTLYGSATVTQLPARVTVVNATGKYSDIFYNAAGQVTGTTYYQGNGQPPV